MTSAAEALEEHGFSGEQLIGLSRKAANDALRRHGAHLDHPRFEELVSYMLEVGCRYAPRWGIERGARRAPRTRGTRPVLVRHRSVTVSQNPHSSH